ncbi:unnamed protein product [Orchesella dallaii]|uniref:Uncharacterized protein n=1 Tax=Orchesella dallaii TaxID=48710 RepID=A0ABP1RIK1_9HEXA
MGEVAPFTPWPQTQPILLQHFCDSTIEFMWDEQNLITSSTFLQCIALNCVLLNFNIIWVGTPLKNSTQKNDPAAQIRENTLKTLLESNAKATSNPRFSSRDILLISDSKFPPKHGSYHILQILIFRRILYKPVKIPFAFVIPISTSTSFKQPLDQNGWQVNTIFNGALLIFVGSNGSTVGIGCFTCNINHFKTKWQKNWNLLMTITTVENIPPGSKSFSDLFMFWERIHTNIYFKAEAPRQKCLSISSYNIRPYINDGRCEIHVAYFLHTNCTSFLKCYELYYTFLDIKFLTPLGYQYLQQIMPFIQHPLEFSYQILLPKKLYFDANLDAYLIPFTLKVWLCMLVAIVSISLWLIFVENENFDYVIFWHFAILLEQEVSHLVRAKNSLVGRTLTIILIWVFSALSLRIFYTSSLYSFMTAEREPKYDVPESMEKLLTREDFDLITPRIFYNELRWLSELDQAKLPRRLEKFYIEILKKSSVMDDRSGPFTEVLKNATNGNYTNLRRYHPKKPLSDSVTLVDFIVNHFDGEFEKKKFTKFAVMCYNDCDNSWNVALLLQNELHREVSKQKPFFKSMKVWIQDYTSFGSVNFRKFLGWYVQSGLYQLAYNRGKMLIDLQYLLLMNKNAEVKMGNGSLFSYVVIMNKKKLNVAEQKPTKLSALTGTFMLAIFMMSVALLLFLWEFSDLLKIGKYFSDINYCSSC